jgi:enoyl-CoA hydratase/carnithine racemase
MANLKDHPIRITREQSWTNIELHEPGRADALSASLVEALIRAFSEASDSAVIDTVVFHGSGRNFCTGFDLSGIETQSDADLLRRFVRIESLLDQVWTSRLRTVAIGTGRVWGAGADLFAACDVRIARSDCRFRFPGAGFGIVLGTRRLSLKVGEDTARHWTTTGVEVSAEEALAAGFAARIVNASETVDDALRQLAPVSVDTETLAGLHRASRQNESDRDLALLVRSASLPGLKDRIIAYTASRRIDRP